MKLQFGRIEMHVDEVTIELEETSNVIVYLLLCLLSRVPKRLGTGRLGHSMSPVGTTEFLTSWKSTNLRGK